MAESKGCHCLTNSFFQVVCVCDFFPSFTVLMLILFDHSLDWSIMSLLFYAIMCMCSASTYSFVNQYCLQQHIVIIRNHVCDIQKFLELIYLCVFFPFTHPHLFGIDNVTDGQSIVFVKSLNCTNVFVNWRSGQLCTCFIQVFSLLHKGSNTCPHEL